MDIVRDSCSDLLYSAFYSALGLGNIAFFSWSTILWISAKLGFDKSRTEIQEENIADTVVIDKNM